ncbi:Uncharacterised protein [Mycobacteroides abscessus]|nr:Uncharacterised protein [Mycobacteroides abscessus]
MSTYGSSTRRKPSVGRSGMRWTSMPRAGRSSRWTNRCVFSLTLEKYTSDPTGTHLRPALLRLLPYGFPGASRRSGEAGQATTGETFCARAVIWSGRNPDQCSSPATTTGACR